MGAILKSIDDPRDVLDKARRPELVRFARANGLKDITEAMPAILIRRRLRQENLTHIVIPPRQLGQPLGGQGGGGGKAFVPAPDDTARAIDAEADLARQFAQYQHVAPVAPPQAEQKSLGDMNIVELGKEMKRLNIRRARTDKMPDMRAKIAAHLRANG